MSIGFRNTIAIFQHIMNDIFRKFLNNFVVIYLDDILVFSNNSKEHKKYLHFCLKKNQEKKVQKWRNVLVKQRFRFGYIIFNSGLSIDPKKVRTIINLQTLSSIPKLLLFWIGICLSNFHQKLLKEYCPFHTI